MQERQTARHERGADDEHGVAAGGGGHRGLGARCGHAVAEENHVGLQHAAAVGAGRHDKAAPRVLQLHVAIWAHHGYLVHSIKELRFL
jgi:hypothetical protein